MKPGKKVLGVGFFPIVGGVLLVALMWEFVPLRSADFRLDRIPESGLGFSSVDIPLSEGEVAVLKGARTLKRVYEFGDQRIWFTCVDGSMNRNAVHDPTYCIRGAGWKIRSELPVQMPSGQAKLIVADRRGETVHLLFWFSDGASNYHSVIRYWFESTLRRITFGLSGEESVLVMVQVPAGSGGGPNWDTIVGDFIPRLGI